MLLILYICNKMNEEKRKGRGERKNVKFALNFSFKLWKVNKEKNIRDYY